MNETIQVAVITLIAGLIGSAIGSLTTICVTNKTFDEERKKTLRADRIVSYGELASAYGALIAHGLSNPPSHKNIPQSEEVQKVVVFQNACAKAQLLAEPQTCDALEMLYKATLSWQGGLDETTTNKVSIAYNAAMRGMRSDIGLPINSPRGGKSTR